MEGDHDMKITVGERKIQVREIYGEKEYHNDGKIRPTLRVSTDVPLTDEDVSALLANDWEVIDTSTDGSDFVASIQRGFGAIHRYQTVFIQTETADERETALRQRIAELEAQNQETAAAFEAVTQELTATKAVLPIDITFTTADTKKGE